MHAEGQGGVGRGGVSKNQAWHILHCTSPLPINNDQSLSQGSLRVAAPSPPTKEKPYKLFKIVFSFPVKL